MTSTQAIQQASSNINSTISQAGNWGAAVSTGFVAFMMAISVLMYVFTAAKK